MEGRDRGGQGRVAESALAKTPRDPQLPHAALGHSIPWLAPRSCSAQHLYLSGNCQPAPRGAAPAAVDLRLGKGENRKKRHLAEVTDLSSLMSWTRKHGEYGRPHPEAQDTNTTINTVFFLIYRFIYRISSYL